MKNDFNKICILNYITILFGGAILAEGIMRNSSTKYFEFDYSGSGDVV